MTAPVTDDKPEAILFDARDVPISLRFDDPYYSFQDGFSESQYVFLDGNDLEDRLEDGFHIGELGFGTGLNFLLTWQAWENTGKEGQIHFTSFEAFPMHYADREKSLSVFKNLARFSELFMDQFDGRNFETDAIKLEVIIGDARRSLPNWNEMADAWFLDGFSPAKNPELWEAPLLQAVYDHTKKGGSFSSYSAAGFVRRNLAEAGFDVERVKGYGHKRHMSRGIKS